MGKTNRTNMKASRKQIQSKVIFNIFKAKTDNNKIKESMQKQQIKIDRNRDKGRERENFNHILFIEL